jgi:hypothetical protein
VQNAHAPSYDSLSLSSEQLTEDMAGTEQLNISLRPGNLKILPHCLKIYGFKIFNLELPSKEITFPMH